MNRIIKAAWEVIDGADDTGCDGDLTVTIKSAVRRLEKAVKSHKKVERQGDCEGDAT